MAGTLKNIALLSAVALAFLLMLVSAYFIWQGMQLQDRLKELSIKQADTEMRLQQLVESQAQLQASYERAKNELDAANENITSSSAKISLLQSQLAEKERQLSESRVNLEEQQQKAAKIASDFSSLEHSINESMSWFRDNAALPLSYGSNMETFKRRMYDDCVDKGELNLACISYLMENTAFSIHYRTDSEKGKLDFLQSVKQTIDTGWGDCEDYSLIFKAELNTMKAAHSGLVATAFTGGTGQFRVYPKESIPESDIGSFWYVPNAKKVRLGPLDSLYPYVICFRATSDFGHCTVALSENRIDDSSQLSMLSGAQVFEPQTGQYLGRVGSEYSVCSSSDCLYEYRAIMLVISDSDLYKFENGEWTGYSDYAAAIAQEKNALSGTA